MSFLDRWLNKTKAEGSGSKKRSSELEGPPPKQIHKDVRVSQQPVPVLDSSDEDEDDDEQDEDDVDKQGEDEQSQDEDDDQGEDEDDEQGEAEDDEHEKKSEDDEEGYQTPPKNPKRKPIYQQKVRLSWLKEKAFQDWLVVVDGSDDKVRCKFCNRLLKAKLSILWQHCKSKSHIDAALPVSNQRKLNIPVKNTTHIKTVSAAEVRQSIFIATHATFRSTDHLTLVTKESFKDSKVAVDMKLGRTKCAAIVKNVVYPFLHQELQNDVHKRNFSLIIDESTDISVHKQLSIVIRYFSIKTEQIKTAFLKLVQLNQGDAESIFKAIMEVLSEFNLDIQNMMGLATDNASVMVGVNAGVIKKLQDLNKRIMFIPCVCHSLQLSVSHAAALHLPRHIEFIISETYNWFSRSSSRRLAYKRLYQAINNGHDPLKIVQACNTRWLSIETAVNRVSEQWVELETHFAIAKMEEKSYMAEQLHQMYKDKGNLCYIYFLLLVLEPVQKVNKMFESNNADPTKLLNDMEFLIKLLTNIIVPARPDFDPFKSTIADYIIPCPYLGYRFEEKVKTLRNDKEISESDENILRTRCINFLIGLIEELRCRLPKNMDILKKIELFSIDKTMDRNRGIIIPLLEEFNLDATLIEKIVVQWNTIYQLDTNEFPQDSINFWVHVSKVKDSLGENPFKDISNFVLDILALPISNAEVERVFSKMNLLKTKQRNRFENAMLNSIIFLKSHMKQNSVCCSSFSIKNDILSRIGNMQTYSYTIPNTEIESFNNMDLEILEDVPQF